LFGEIDRYHGGDISNAVFISRDHCAFAQLTIQTCVKIVYKRIALLLGRRYLFESP
jgi:hypothetical protein